MSNKLQKLLPLKKPSHSFQSPRYSHTDYSLTFPPDSLVTKQSFGPECDINTIMARYQSTGEMPVINQVAPQYLELGQSDFQDAMQIVAGAQSLFAELPSALRSRFNNDPGQFLAFTTDPNNRAEMHKLGMLKPGASPDQPTTAPTKSAASVATGPETLDKSNAQ